MLYLTSIYFKYYDLHKHSDINCVHILRVNTLIEGPNVRVIFSVSNSFFTYKVLVTHQFEQQYYTCEPL